MKETVTVSFKGPFSWTGMPDAPSIFDAETRESGVYLWTVPQHDGYLIYYVGETGRSFQTRLLEHYVQHAACMYHVYLPAEFARGEKILLWPGRYDPSDRKSARECIAQYSRLSAQIWELTLLYRFFLAPLSCEDRTRRRIEAAIADALYPVPGIVGDFQDKGIRYDRRKTNEEPIVCTITSSAPLFGLPTKLEV